MMYGIQFKVIGNCIKRNIMTRDDNQVEALRAPEEECEASDDND